MGGTRDGHARCCWWIDPGLERVRVSIRTLSAAQRNGHNRLIDRRSEMVSRMMTGVSARRCIGATRATRGARYWR
jgi:hypothetical protein